MRSALIAATFQARAQGGLPANAGVPLESVPLTRASLLPLSLLGPTLRSLKVGLIALNSLKLGVGLLLFRLIPSFQSKLGNSMLSAFPASVMGVTMGIPPTPTEPHYFLSCST